MEDLYKDLLNEGQPLPSSDKNKKSASLEANLGLSSNNSEKIKSSKSNDKSKSDSTDGSRAVEKLAEVMQNGFLNMQQLLVDCLSTDIGSYENLEEDESFDSNGDDQSDLFASLANEMNRSEKLGPAVSESLATLADKLLSTSVDLKNDEQKHLRPENVKFLSAPQINKPIWGNLSQSAKTRDVRMQTIQSKFLSSAIPTLKVMQLLHDNFDDPSQLDIKELLRSLCDSLSFVGNANMDMVKIRRSFIKKELPSNMHGLCLDSVSFSDTNLFGNSLSSDIKEVSELNKISGRLRGRVRGNIRAFNARGSFSGRSSFRRINRFPFKRGGFARFNRRFAPTQTSSRSNLNRKGPSKE